jgi:hypothetical protein
MSDIVELGRCRINGQKFTAKHTAKVSGDTLQGKVVTQRDGQTQTRKFAAKRVK